MWVSFEVLLGKFWVLYYTITFDVNALNILCYAIVLPFLVSTCDFSFRTVIMNFSTSF